jgi:hypothetical protein
MTQSQECDVLTLTNSKEQYVHDPLTMLSVCSSRPEFTNNTENTRSGNRSTCENFKNPRQLIHKPNEA